jgi:hypothetical protein
MRRLVIASLAMMIEVLLACGGSRQGARGPGRGLPSYAGHAVELFDDGIEARAVGYELDRTTPPMNDSLVRERAQVGDVVVRARVMTVTSKDEDRGRSWQVGFRTIETLAGSGQLEADFTVQVVPGGPAAGIMRAFEGRLIGKTFIAFVREFAHAGAPDDSDLHFHLAPDAKDEREAVHAAITMDKVR